MSAYDREYIPPNLVSVRFWKKCTVLPLTRPAFCGDLPDIQFMATYDAVISIPLVQKIRQVTRHVG
jgi:hypothetical protein